MEHKYSEIGFSLQIILTLVLLIAAIVLSGWYVFSHNNLSKEDAASRSYSFAPGSISVTFNDGVTFYAAKELITSYRLTLDQPDSVYQEEFTPHDYRSIKSDQFEQISNKLKAYDEVSSFSDATDDPGNRAGPGHMWVKFTFRQDVTLQRMKMILTSSGLGLGETPQNPVIVFRDVYLKVPSGQENRYISKFKSNSIVKTASRVSRPVLQ